MARSLDDLDRSIVRELRRDGRQTVSHLASLLRVPRSTITKRLQALERDKIITGYKACVDHKALGQGLTAFVLVRMRQDPIKTSDAAGPKVAEVAGVEEVHQITGDWDLILKLRARDHEDLLNVLNRVVAVRGIDRSSTMTALATYQEGS